MVKFTELLRSKNYIFLSVSTGVPIIFCARKINTIFIFALDNGWTGQVDRVDRSLSTWLKKSDVISVGYHLLFSTLSALSSMGNSGIFLSG